MTDTQSVPQCRDKQMVILRTHQFGKREKQLLAELSACGVELAVAVDETRGAVDVGPYAKVSVTRHACRSLGLHCPTDFAWRNGDYCLYLSRRRFPKINHFWLIEADVEHSFRDFGHFMTQFNQRLDIEFLSAYFQPAEPNWHWRGTVPRGPDGTFRCFFPLIRISAKAIEACLQQRLRDRFSITSRLYWANDEAFVANTILCAGLKACDFNGLGSIVYTEESFGYVPLDGTAGTFRAVLNRIFHPVLYDEAYKARLARIGAARNTMIDRLGLNLQRRLRGTN